MYMHVYNTLYTCTCTNIHEHGHAVPVHEQVPVRWAVTRGFLIKSSLMHMPFRYLD